MSGAAGAAWAIAVAGVLATLGACRSEGNVEDGPLAPVPPSASWGRATPPARASASASARARALVEPGSPESPEALAELLGAAASATVPSPPGAAIGSDTGLAKTSEPAARAAPAPSASAAKGEPNPEQVERAARSELYWPLTQRCRDEKGALLPPESIEIYFRVDDDGRIVGSTIVTLAKEKRFDRASICMRRELSKSSFRAPAGARRTLVHLLAPPLD